MTPKAQRQLALLASALKRCAGTEDRRIARRNARARVLKALRAVRSHLDREFPAIMVRKPSTHASLLVRRKRLEKAGWEVVEQGIGLFAAAGVPVKRLPLHGGGHKLLVPRWAVVIGPENQAQLRAAKKSKQLRDAAIVRAALLDGA